MATKEAPQVIVPEKKSEEKEKYRIHVVVKGDTLRELAGKYLGKPSRADEIRRLNKLATDILTVGRKLKIPQK